MIDNILKKKDASDAKYNFLRKCIISCENYYAEEKRFIRNMVSMGGGMFFNKTNFMCTHILCDYYSDFEQNKILGASDNAKIVSLDWLIKSF